MACPSGGWLHPPRFSGLVNHVGRKLRPLREATRHETADHVLWQTSSGAAKAAGATLFKCALTKNGIPDDSGGIYVFVSAASRFFLQPLYVGKAANLRGRLLGHEKWGKAWWILGATERHVMRVGSEDERRMIEEDLIRGLKPRMNDVQMPRSEQDAPNTPQLKKSWIWRRKVEAWFRKLFGMTPKHPVETYSHTHRHTKGHPDVAPNEYWKKSA